MTMLEEFQAIEDSMIDLLNCNMERIIKRMEEDPKYLLKGNDLACLRKLSALMTKKQKQLDVEDKLQRKLEPKMQTEETLPSHSTQATKTTALPLKTQPRELLSPTMNPARARSAALL